MRYTLIAVVAVAFLATGCPNNTVQPEKKETTPVAKKTSGEKDLADYYTVEVHPEGKSIVIAIFNHKLVKNNDDTWAAALLGGFEVSNRSANDNDALAVGFSYTAGNVEAYAVSAADYRAFKSKRMSQEDFINQIKKIK